MSEQKCECPVRKALEVQRKAWDGVIANEVDGPLVDFAEAQIRRIDAAIVAPCPCAAERDDLRAQLAAFKDPKFERLMADLRERVDENRQLRAELKAAQSKVEEHQRWLEADSQHAENQRLRAEVDRWSSELLNQICRAETAEKITAEERIIFDSRDARLRAELSEALKDKARLDWICADIHKRKAYIYDYAAGKTLYVCCGSRADSVRGAIDAAMMASK